MLCHTVFTRCYVVVVVFIWRCINMLFWVYVVTVCLCGVILCVCVCVVAFSVYMVFCHVVCVFGVVMYCVCGVMFS